MGNVVSFPTQEVDFGTMFLYAPAELSYGVKGLAIDLSDNFIEALSERLSLMGKIRDMGEPVETMTYVVERGKHFELVGSTKNQLVHEAIQSTYEQDWCITEYTTDYEPAAIEVQHARLVFDTERVWWEIHTNMGAFQSTPMTMEDLNLASKCRFRPGSDRTDGSSEKL